MTQLVFQDLIIRKILYNKKSKRQKSISKNSFCLFKRRVFLDILRIAKKVFRLGFYDEQTSVERQCVSDTPMFTPRKTSKCIQKQLAKLQIQRHFMKKWRCPNRQWRPRQNVLKDFAVGIIKQGRRRAPVTTFPWINNH